MKIWKIYELAIIGVALINWLILEVFVGTVYKAFWWIIIVYSLITFGFSMLLAWGEKKRPMNFFTCFTAGKALKFMATLALLLVCMLVNPEHTIQYVVTAGSLFLVTLIIDTAVVLKFARFLRRKKYETY